MTEKNKRIRLTLNGSIRNAPVEFTLLVTFSPGGGIKGEGKLQTTSEQLNAICGTHQVLKENVTKCNIPIFVGPARFVCTEISDLQKFLQRISGRHYEMEKSYSNDRNSFS